MTNNMHHFIDDTLSFQLRIDSRCRKMWKCGNVEMWKCGNAEMRNCGNVVIYDADQQETEIIFLVLHSNFGQ